MGTEWMRLKGIMRLNEWGGKIWGRSEVGMDLGGERIWNGYRMDWNWSKTRPGFGLRVNGGILSKGGWGKTRNGSGRERNGCGSKGIMRLNGGRG